MSFCKPFTRCECGRDEWLPYFVVTAVASGFAGVAVFAPLLMVTLVAIALAAAQRRAYPVVAAAVTGATGGLAFLVAGPNLPFVLLAMAVVVFLFAFLAFLAYDPDDHNDRRHAGIAWDGHHHGLERRPSPGPQVAALLLAWTRQTAEATQRHLDRRAVQRVRRAANAGRAGYLRTAPPPPPPGTVLGLPPPYVGDVIDVDAIEAAIREGARVPRT